MNLHCKNPKCGKKITITIFQGEDFCSANCKKALGLIQPAGNLVFLSPAEEQMVRQLRDT